MNNQKNYLILPSKKRPWYYIERSGATIHFFVKNLLTSENRLLNRLIQLSDKLLPIDKLLLIMGHRSDCVDESVKSAIISLKNSIKLSGTHFIIRKTTWHRRNDKFILFIFNGKNEKPNAIAKCLSSQFSNNLQNEFTNMQNVAGYFENTSISVPIPLKFIKTEGYSIYVEKFCEGIALNDLGNREFSFNKRLHLYFQGLGLVDKLLYRFTDFKKRMPSAIYEKYIKNAIEGFEKSSQLTNVYPFKFSKLKQSAKKIKNKNIASIPMHGDLWGGSILINGYNATVIDWEFYQKEGIPLWDLFMYFIHPGFVLNGRNKGLFSEFRAFSENENVLSKINNILFRFQENLNLEIEDVEFLFQTFLIYNSITRDNETEKNWEKCLNHYWASEPLWVGN